MEITLKIKSLRLIHRTNFVERVLENSQNSETYKAAYFKTEEEYKEIFGKHRYSSYESFKVSKHRCQKKIKEDRQLKLF